MTSSKVPSKMSDRTSCKMSTFICTMIFVTSINSISCASFSSASHHHQQPSHQPSNIKLKAPPSPISAALRSARASSSLEIMPMGDIKKAVGESFVVICRVSSGSGGVSDFKWFDPNGQEMFTSKDISIMSSNNNERKQLAFMNPSVNDAGTYTCSGRSQNSELLEAKVRVVIYGKCHLLLPSIFYHLVSSTLLALLLTSSPSTTCSNPSLPLFLAIIIRRDYLSCSEY